ncbi:MerR family transcriptional regulator [uncultured Paraglaciecola sp.]|uniref:MerR family transcriptional regulator n=1 Tax=uncultured Paraglaciecola sp. TaxID=1765024 RepID=UPI0026232549|nr:MerR family transcriptional regulator [uncultured Paraglaciecola sp.]
MKPDKELSVSQLSKIAGVSVRTLHHYDLIGLLKPNRGENGYRIYNQKHLVLLQQIVIYRELDFALADIQHILHTKDFDQLQALKDQNKLLLARQKTTGLMIKSLQKTMNMIEGKKNLEILFSELPKVKVERWNTMLEQGLAEEGLEEQLSALGQLTNDQAKTEQQQFDIWVDSYIKILAQPIDSLPVQNSIKAHYIMINGFFRKLYPDNYKGIGFEGYLKLTDEVLSNPVSNEMYEHYQMGMANHLHDAMAYFSENTLQQNLDSLRVL